MESFFGDPAFNLSFLTLAEKIKEVGPKPCVSRKTNKPTSREEIKQAYTEEEMQKLKEDFKNEVDLLCKAALLIRESDDS